MRGCAPRGQPFVGGMQPAAADAAPPAAARALPTVIGTVQMVFHATGATPPQDTFRCGHCQSVLQRQNLSKHKPGSGVQCIRQAQRVANRKSRAADASVVERILSVPNICTQSSAASISECCCVVSGDSGNTTPGPTGNKGSGSDSFGSIEKHNWRFTQGFWKETLPSPRNCCKQGCAQARFAGMVNAICAGGLPTSKRQSVAGGRADSSALDSRALMGGKVFVVQGILGGMAACLCNVRHARVAEDVIEVDMALRTCALHGGQNCGTGGVLSGEPEAEIEILDVDCGEIYDSSQQFALEDFPSREFETSGQVGVHGILKFDEIWDPPHGSYYDGACQRYNPEYVLSQNKIWVGQSVGKVRGGDNTGQTQTPHPWMSRDNVLHFATASRVLRGSGPVVQLTARRLTSTSGSRKRRADAWQFGQHGAMHISMGLGGGGDRRALHTRRQRGSPR
eukprot:gene16196-biopygen722